MSLVSDWLACAVAVIRCERRIPFVVVPGLASDMQPGLDIADLKHFALADQLSVFPKH